MIKHLITSVIKHYNLNETYKTQNSLTGVFGRLFIIALSLTVLCLYPYRLRMDWHRSHLAKHTTLTDVMNGVMKTKNMS